MGLVARAGLWLLPLRKPSAPGLDKIEHPRFEQAQQRAEVLGLPGVLHMSVMCRVSGLQGIKEAQGQED